MMRYVSHMEQFLRAYCASPWCQPLITHQQNWLLSVLSKQFGYVALQVGCAYSISSAWHSCKIPRQLILSDHVASGVNVVSNFEDLPIKSDSLDVVVLLHSLELVEDPYVLLREVERILITEGRVVLLGFSPVNAWRGRWFGRHRAGLGRLSFYRAGRVVDWLQALGFEIEQVQFYPDVGWRRWLPWLATPCSQGYGLVARKARSRVRLIGLRDGWRWQSLLPQLARRNMIQRQGHEKD